MTIQYVNERPSELSSEGGGQSYGFGPELSTLLRTHIRKQLARIPRMFYSLEVTVPEMRVLQQALNSYIGTMATQVGNLARELGPNSLAAEELARDAVVADRLYDKLLQSTKTLHIVTNPARAQ